MDADNDILTSKVEILDQNGAYIDHLVLEGNDNVPEEVETRETEQVKTRKQQNCQSRSKIEKPSNAKSVVATSLKKTNDNKEMKATSNGALSLNAQTKQPVANIRSVDEREVTNSNLIKTTKAALATSKCHKTKPPKSEAASSSENSVQSDGTVDKAKLKPLRKGPPVKAELSEECVECPTDSDTKPCRVGKLPSYGFNFKCNERAEKRKEFYSKLEEKIHAQEVERTNQQAKSKESQESEIKMLRKSLNFKATPMPSFYQEPPPPKVELKKIPPTQPRSPKLGRKKNSLTEEAEGDDELNHPPLRPSLDEKAVSHSNRGKGPSTQFKRPQRKSLPRSPSEKTGLSKTAHVGASAPQVVDNMVNGTAPIARVVEEEGPLSDPGQPQAGAENGILVEDQSLPTIEQEGGTADH